MGLRFKLDENLSGRIGPALRALGHDVQTAEFEGLAGACDPDLLAACQSESRVLITLDLDFADIRNYPPRSHCSIWVLRPAKQTFAQVLAAVLGGLRLATVEQTDGQLWVIDDKRVRIRD